MEYDYERYGSITILLSGDRIELTAKGDDSGMVVGLSLTLEEAEHTKNLLKMVIKRLRKKKYEAHVGI